MVLVEVSPAYETAARELGHSEAVDYRLGDFVALGDEMDSADIVVLGRVVCCYPDMLALVAASAVRARRYYLLVVPREKWLWRALEPVIRVGMRLLRREFRFFVHPLMEIDRQLEAA